MVALARFRRSRTGRTVSCSTSTSTAITAPASAPATRRDGRGGSPVSSMSSRPSRQSSCSQAVRGPISSQPRMGRVAHGRTLARAAPGEMRPVAGRCRLLEIDPSRYDAWVGDAVAKGCAHRENPVSWHRYTNRSALGRPLMKPCDLQPSLSWPRRSGGPCLRAMLLVAALATPVAFAQEKPPTETPRQLSLENKPWKGDFDQMLERRVVRVLIPYSRTLFFNDKGREGWLYLLAGERPQGGRGPGREGHHAIASRGRSRPALA